MFHDPDMRGRRPGVVDANRPQLKPGYRADLYSGTLYFFEEKRLPKVMPASR